MPKKESSGGKRSETGQRFEEGKDMARAQEITICGSSESAGYQFNPFRLSPRLPCYHIPEKLLSPFAQLVETNRRVE
jgi:hypothetical protein